VILTLILMKANQKKRLTFGDLIASVYTACSQRRARAIYGSPSMRTWLYFEANGAS